MFRKFLNALARWPYRFLAVAAVLALLLCLLPLRVDAPGQVNAPQTAQSTSAPQMQGVPAGADLSERTQSGCALHRTIYYAPCGHSVQRRESLPAALVGLSRSALETEMDSVIPGAQITGFSAQEVDISVQVGIPCPLHWVLKTGSDGKLTVLQNVNGDSLSVVRTTDISASTLSADMQAQLAEGMVFDQVQTLEGYLENLSS